MIFLMLCFWVLVTGVCFFYSKKHNKNCKVDVLLITWEPYVVSGLFLLLCSVSS